MFWTNKLQSPGETLGVCDFRNWHLTGGNYQLLAISITSRPTWLRMMTSKRVCAILVQHKLNRSTCGTDLTFCRNKIPLYTVSQWVQFCYTVTCHEACVLKIFAAWMFLIIVICVRSLGLDELTSWKMCCLGINFWTPGSRECSSISTLVGSCVACVEHPSMHCTVLRFSHGVPAAMQQSADGVSAWNGTMHSKLGHKSSTSPWLRSKTFIQISLSPVSNSVNNIVVIFALAWLFQ